MAVPVVDTNLEIARLALGELNRTLQKPLPADMLADAEYYVGEGFSVLKSHSTYDPATDANHQANMAVVEYVKARLIGQPYMSSNFPPVAQIWMRAAAKEVFEAGQV